MTLLNILQNVGEATLQVIDEGFLNPAYAFTKPSRLLLGLDRYSPEDKTNKSVNRLNRKKIFSTTLYRLKKDGLIKKSSTHKGIEWKLTAEGKKYITHQAPNIESYDTILPAEDGKIRIVSFDVPEDERWKRDRLRYMLITSDYKLLHNSVWLGRRPLAEVVFSEIKFLKINPYIHLFEISKKGTVRDVM